MFLAFVETLVETSIWDAAKNKNKDIKTRAIHRWDEITEHLYNTYYKRYDALRRRTCTNID